MNRIDLKLNKKNNFVFHSNINLKISLKHQIKILLNSLNGKSY